MTNPSLKKDIRDALRTLYKDRPSVRKLFRIAKGKQARPYMPDSADAEFKALARRSITNMFPLLIDASAQALYVDDYRHSSDDDLDAMGDDTRNPYWNHWQASRMDARQGAVYRAALTCGQGFVLTERRREKVLSVCLSASDTATMYELGDWMEPVAAVHVESHPRGKEPGVAYYWDERNKYTIALGNGWRSKDADLTVVRTESHGATHCPVTRFYCYLDDEGNVTGLVEPLIPLQDRLNQSVFDLLVAQTYTSFEIRTVTGMAPPYKKVQDAEGEWVDAVDEDGNPVVDMGAVNARRAWFAEGTDVKFGSLPGGNLSGIIEAIELALRQFTAAGQIPPHYMLGEIVNVNAEALDAASVSLERKNSEIAQSFGEAVERVMRIAGEIEGLGDSESDHGEVVWRDLSTDSLVQTADALGKMAVSLKIPERGLWSRIPRVTRKERMEWERLREEADSDEQWSGVFNENFDQGSGSASTSDGMETRRELANA